MKLILSPGGCAFYTFPVSEEQVDDSDSFLKSLFYSLCSPLLKIYVVLVLSLISSRNFCMYLYLLQQAEAYCKACFLAEIPFMAIYA